MLKINEEFKSYQTLYILYNPLTKLIKIGISSSFERRLKQIENACGCDLVMICKIKCEYTQKIESFLLTIFSNLKVKGEWFDFSKYIDAFESLFYFLDSIFSCGKNNNKSWFFTYSKVFNKKEFFKIIEEIKGDKNGIS